MGTYAVAARNDGFLYVTAQNKNIIYLFDPADIRAGDTGFAPYLVTLGFEKSPQSIAFVGDRLFVTLRVDDKRSELWEISPKNGKLLQDFIGSGSCDPDSKSHWPMIFLLILRNKEDGVPGKSLHLRKLL